MTQTKIHDIILLDFRKDFAEPMTANSPNPPNPLVAKVLTWGRNQNQSHVVDNQTFFDRQQTEAMRRFLRSEFTSRNCNVAGSWRKGYELTIGAEHIGVTNGHASGFRIYYRRNGDAR